MSEEIADGVYRLGATETYDVQGVLGPAYLKLAHCLLNLQNLLDSGIEKHDKIGPERPAFRPGYRLAVIVKSPNVMWAWDIATLNHYKRFYREFGQRIRQGDNRYSFRLYWYKWEDYKKIRLGARRVFKSSIKAQRLVGPPTKAAEHDNNGNLIPFE